MRRLFQKSIIDQTRNKIRKILFYLYRNKRLKTVQVR